MIYCFLVTEKFKAEAYKKYPSGKPKHNQASAYILMLNTGLRTAEALGLINSDIDLEKKVMHIQRGVKEAQKRTRNYCRQAKNRFKQAYRTLK